MESWLDPALHQLTKKEAVAQGREPLQAEALKKGKSFFVDGVEESTFISSPLGSDSDLRIRCQ